MRSAITCTPTPVKNTHGTTPTAFRSIVAGGVADHIDRSVAKNSLNRWGASAV
jgi:hypothetical protein